MRLMISDMKTRFALFLMFLTVGVLRAAGPVYVVLWFDTEDYVEPAADDAALRIASDLTGLGVRATFKVVGEKARVLEQRGRWDVVRALALHEIGYHSNFHSIPPAPSVYLRDLGYVEGAAEFERRERAGALDLQRIFGVLPSCYGQPGSSWGPQSNTALRRMGIPVYLDEGTQVGLNNQPFWYGGLLYIFNMGKYSMRAPLDGAGPVEKSYERFDRAASELAARGGGVISIYYHPTEFVTTEFWDAVNFAKGADRERGDWRRPRRRTEAESERCYGILRAYVAHMKSVPGVRFATAREMLQLYGGPVPRPRTALGSRRILPRNRRSCSAGKNRFRLPICCWRCSEWIRRLWMDRRRGLPVRSAVTRFPALLLSAPRRIPCRSSGRISGCRGGVDRIGEAVDRRLCGHAGRLRRHFRQCRRTAGQPRIRELLLYRSEGLLQLGYPSGGFQRARAARSRPAAGLDTQAGATTVTEAAPECYRVGAW